MIQLPDSRMVQAAHRHAGTHLAEAVMNHSMRVARLSTLIGESETAQLDGELLWVASLFHDLGTAVGADSPDRFEVVGAHEAAAFLQRHTDRDDDEIQEVWDAIALHTSPHIAEARGGLVRAVRLGVLMDFGDDVLEDSATVRRRLEAVLPRLDIEVVLADAVVAQAVAKPEKAPPASWPHDLYASHLADPSREGINPAF